MNVKLFIYFLIVLFVTQNSQSQVVKSKPIDSTKVMYQKIEQNLKKSKFKKFLHKLIFTSTSRRKPSKNDFRDKVDNEIAKNDGKIIRNIKIETLDPFGYSIENDKREPSNSFEKFGNNVHLKTKNWTIKNQLLFKKNQPLDSLLIKESERIIRKQRYVRSVIISTVPIENSKDSVDVTVRVLDSWSLIPNGAISGSRMNTEITERNFFGLGHEFTNDFGRQFSDKQNSYNGKYAINNIKNTFINTTLVYQSTFNNDITRSVRVERTFFSPLIKYAGGGFYENKSISDSLPTRIPEFERLIFQTETKDFWLGYAFKLFKNKSINSRTTNFVTAVGFKNINYIKSAPLILDPNQFLTDEEVYLFSFGVTTQRFIQDKYIFNFDIIEDVPIGKVYSFTTGFQNKNSKNRTYLAGKFSFGQYFNFGYLSTNFEIGSYFNQGNTKETTIKFEANYFTNLKSFGNWRVRQFIKPSFILGINREQSIKDRVLLNEFEGFTNPLFNGTRKFTINFQTQTYAPGTWKGFHFSPFINTAFGLIGDSQDTFLNNKLYSKFSLGVLINNDYLVFNRFQISMSFYPTIPFDGANILKTNTLKNDDFNIPDYSIGQPKIVDFR